MTHPIWVYPPTRPQLVQQIAGEFNIHPVTAQILVTRGYQSLSKVHDFLYSQLPNLYDPDLFPDMELAVSRIISALEKQETLLIIGDTDVDGMTATTLLTEYFRLIGFHKLFYHLPNRSSANLSLFADALSVARRCGATLLITVDCGITAARELTEIATAGIDVIVTDHHAPTAKLPHSIATLNPKLVNSTYPNRELTGVGVAFKLAHAITNELIERERLSPARIDLKPLLDLVALGTIADMGSLTGENRILVRYGLKELRLGRRVGLSRLFALCDLHPSNATPSDIASKIAPRLNSLGRVADPSKGVELLLATDEAEADRLAHELDLHNVHRQKMERAAFEEIEALLLKQPTLSSAPAIFLSSSNWHPGVIPILAARIAKSHNRPTLLLSLENGVAKGSLRTIPEFPLLPILKELEDLLLNYGGHDFAAGLTVKAENISALEKRFLAAASQRLKRRDLQPKLHIDAAINLQELSFDLLESLSLLEPFGNENPPPILYADAIQAWPPKLIGGHHLKLFLMQEDRMLEAIAFHLGNRRSELLRKQLPIRIAFTPALSTFQGKTSIQLHIKDFTL